MKEHKEKDDKGDEKEQKIAELTNMLQRLQAEFENFKKRTESEIQRKVDFQMHGFIKKFLPILDDFDRALDHDDTEGIKHIIANAKTVLSDQGVEQIQAIDQPFDPKYHEALLTETTTVKEKDNTVTEILQQGYKINEDVLQHAKVKVAKYQTEENNHE